MALKQMDPCPRVFARSDAGFAIGQRQRLSLMEEPYPGNWKEFHSISSELCGI